MSASGMRALNEDTMAPTIAPSENEGRKKRKGYFEETDRRWMPIQLRIILQDKNSGGRMRGQFLVVLIVFLLAQVEIRIGTWRCGARGRMNLNMSHRRAESAKGESPAAEARR